MMRIYTLLTLLTSLTFIVQAQIKITDADLLGSSNVTWTANNEYILDGYVFLEAGGTLTIEPGTVVKGIADPSNGDNASALIISRGAKLFAEGTESNPIIFTSELDDLNDNTELTKNDKGLWGGLIILGNAIVGVDGGKENIEGIPSTEGRAEYGGNDNSDNSGVLKYISIRHAGTALEANNEINGLTLGGVGNGTIIEYVEVFANKDDGIELFGGAVNIKHAVVAFCGDDSYDFDQSWNGNGQFWFSIQDENSNRAGEFDGSEASDLSPSVIVTIANATFIGGGATTINGDGNDALRIRAAAATKIYNSIFQGFASRAIRVDDLFEGDTYDRLLAGEVDFDNNVFFDIAAGSTIEAIAKAGDDSQALFDLLNNNSNSIFNPGMGGISREPNNGLDPRVSAFGVLETETTMFTDGFFDNVPYLGAFDNQNNWAQGWTALDKYGFFGNLVQTSVLNQLNIEMLDAYPNPFENQILVSYDLKEKANISIEVFNSNGQQVSMISSTQIGGNHQELIELNNLPSGTYMLTLKENGNLSAVKMILKN